MRMIYFLLMVGLASSLPAYNEDPIQNFHMSNVEPLMAESDVRFVEKEDKTENSKGIQPRSIPYTKAERRRYVHKARLDALRDDSNEFEDLDFKIRGRTVSAYDSAEEDYSDDYVPRAARRPRPFQRIRSYFQRPEPGLYFKSAEHTTERPSIINRLASIFRQSPTNRPQAKEPPRQQQKRRPQKNSDNSKYQVIFWPITTTDTDGVTTTNLVPHLVVKNPKRQEEILYAVPLVQLTQHGDYNIFHTADEKEINSIKKIKSKKRKNRPGTAAASQQQRPSVNDDEVMMEHIIQSGSDVEDETTTSPPPVPSFIFVGDNPADTEEDVDDADVDDSDNKLRSNKNRTYRRRYNNKHRW